MRPNHQNNKRMRGRNRPNGSGGGKGPNPLTRSYESNGPDVKIRGTAQHVAEKYVQLGRDAQATGDHVAAESYFQHAEHYFRLIAAAQEVFRQQNPQYRPYETSSDQDDEGEDEPPFGQGSAPSEPRFPAQSAGGEGDEQPRLPYAPQQRDYQPREPREFQPREPRGEQRDYQPRERRDYQPREPREFQPREFQPREPREPREFQPRDNRGPREPRFAREPRVPAPDVAAQDAGLPAFITAPVRTLPGITDETAPAEVLAPVNGDEAAAFPLRTRRRRGRPRVEGGEATAPDDAPVGE